MMAPLALRIMNGSASTSEQRNYAQRMIVAGERLRRRAERMSGAVIEGEILADGPRILPASSINTSMWCGGSCWESWDGGSA
ncbi:MAG: hypothetical protein ACRDRS_04330 [Pseudonocardiaceae bacterium]